MCLILQWKSRAWLSAEFGVLVTNIAIYRAEPYKNYKAELYKAI